MDAGTLTLDHVGSEDTSPCRDINFDPLVLPEGMAPSDDPLLNARSAVYSGRSPDAQARRTTERGYAFRGAKVSMSGATEQQQFTALMRLFHWLTATLVLTILGIGLAMVHRSPTIIVWCPFTGRWVFSF